VRQGVEILVADRGKILQPRSAVVCFWVTFAAVDRDLMTTSYEPGGEFLGERLEAPVIGGNASSAPGAKFARTTSGLFRNGNAVERPSWAAAY